MRMMSKFVLARHWRKANESQQQRFSQAFKELLVRTYATAMLKYKDEKIKVLPSAGAGDERKALVRTEFKPSDGGPTVPIHYSFYKNKEGEWKVYDMNIERISLVTNYRSAYAEKIAKDGIEALIESINKTDKQEVIGRSQ